MKKKQRTKQNKHLFIERDLNLIMHTRREWCKNIFYRVHSKFKKINTFYIKCLSLYDFRNRTKMNKFASAKKKVKNTSNIVMPHLFIFS